MVSLLVCTLFTTFDLIVPDQRHFPASIQTPTPTPTPLSVDSGLGRTPPCLSQAIDGGNHSFRFSFRRLPTSVVSARHVRRVPGGSQLPEAKRRPTRAGDLCRRMVDRGSRTRLGRSYLGRSAHRRFKYPDTTKLGNHQKSLGPVLLDRDHVEHDSGGVSASILGPLATPPSRVWAGSL